MQLSFPMNLDLRFEDIYKHDRKTPLDHLSYNTPSKSYNTPSKFSKILTLLHEVHLV